MFHIARLAIALASVNRTTSLLLGLREYRYTNGQYDPTDRKERPRE